MNTGMSDDHSMHILYGVSADGNGHVARARALIPELEKRGAKVTTLFSGSTSPIAIDASVFKNVINRGGFTRSVEGAHVNMFKTVAANLMQLPKLAHEVLTMDLRPYDVVISDFEPVSAFSRRFRNLISGQHKPSIGIANQYAYEKGVPRAPGLLMGNAHNLALAKTRLGMHFHHFGKEGILPPFIADMPPASEPEEGKILVYLGFDNVDDIKTLLKPYEGYNFHVYSKQASEQTVEGHITINPINREAFRKDFADCEGVITGAGFMTPSEALYMGKKLLLKPMDGHPEQLSNAMALEEMGAAHVMCDLDPKALDAFLHDDHAMQIIYPDVVSPLADWVAAGEYSRRSANMLCDDLWDKTDIHDDRIDPSSSSVDLG
tara:strand:- start:38838 stop:39968 length:1131 start_codon:yes stop_codon:yes gene_type:complete